MATWTLVPKLRSSSCSASSMQVKKVEKCMMPAASVSRNCTRRRVRKAAHMRRSSLSETSPRCLRAAGRGAKNKPAVAEPPTGLAEYLSRYSPVYGNKRHEASALDRSRDGVLTGCRTARLAASDDPAVAIDQLFEQLNVLVVDIHRTRPFAVHVNRILLLRANARFGSFAGPDGSFHGVGLASVSA